MQKKYYLDDYGVLITKCATHPESTDEKVMIGSHKCLSCTNFRGLNFDKKEITCTPISATR